MKREKVQKRVGDVVWNTVQNLMPIFLGIILALLVIRLLSPNLWGEFVSVQIWVFLAAHLAGWGNRDRQLLQFSAKPAEIGKTWAKNFVARAPLILVALLLLFLPISWPVKLLALLWVAARFWAQSFDAPVLYSKRFRLSLVADFILYLLLFIFLFFVKEKIQLLHLVAGVAAAEFLKALILSIAFKNLVKHIRPVFSTKELAVSLPFFLLGFSGLLQSKVDLYIVSATLPPADVSTYQVYLGFLFLLFGIPNYIILPIAKNLYRMGIDSFGKLRKRLMYLAIPAAAAGLAVVWIILTYLYQLELSAALLTAGFLFVLPAFYYSPLIHQLFRLRKQNIVVTVNFCGFVVVLLPGIFLVKFFGIAGALMAAAANQWLMLAIYHYLGRSLVKQKAEERISSANLVTEMQL